MVEKMTFVPSGLVKDVDNKAEIEAWGHDAGEFVNEEIDEEQPEVETKKEV